MLARFNITNCTGDIFHTLVIRIEDDDIDLDEWDLVSKYRSRILGSRGIIPRKCDTCRDSNPQVRFVGLVQKMRDLLSDEAYWTKGAWARDQNNNPVNTCRSEAECWCLLGAIQRVYPYPKSHGIHFKVREYLSPTPFTYSISQWNDAKERTFAEIKELVETLDI